MNKPLLSLGFCLIMGIASAQYQPIIKLNPLQSDTSFSQKLPKDLIPNALAQYELNKMLLLKGNNGDGFDMYQSTIDGMTIASPDKSQSYNIPNSLPKNKLLIIAKSSEFNTGNLQLRIPQPFTDTMYIAPFNTKTFSSKSAFKK